MTAEFFRDMTVTRYREQPWHPDVLRRFAPHGRLLEIGCGAGTDHAELQKDADQTVAIDLALRGAKLTRRRLELETGIPGLTMVADGERLPFRSSSFDCVYSFGVIHHTDHPEVVVREMQRVLVPGGKFLVGLYHRHSLFAFKILLLYVLKGGPLRMRWADHLAERCEAGASELNEKPKVLLYSRRQARRLFAAFSGVSVEVVHARLPSWLPFRSWIERHLGWYVLTTGVNG
jgi:ubiquinone/menaquinone biosynthesis C-methylase UbiE